MRKTLEAKKNTVTLVHDLNGGSQAQAALAFAYGECRKSKPPVTARLASVMGYVFTAHSRVL